MATSSCRDRDRVHQVHTDVPRLLRGRPALPASDAPKLAKFDLIDIPRFRYGDIGPNTWAAIKSINPGVQIYLYEMGPETPSHLDDTPQLYLNGLGRYNVSRGHFMGSLNGDHPELYLLDSSGNRVYSTVLSNVSANQYWHLMDFGTAAYQSYWLTAVKADIVDQPWVADGVFVDNCLALPDAGRYSGTPSMYPSNAAWSGAMISFTQAITAGMYGYGQKLWCNGGETTMADGSAAWLALDGSASPPDVLLEPGAFAVASGSWAVQFYGESQWKRQVDTIGAIRNSRVAMMSHTRLAEGETGTDNWGKPVNYWQTLWYSLGSFLLSKNDDLGNAYFMFNGGSGYDRIWWYDEYDNIDLGKAIGPYRVTTVGSVNVYWREFERGYVYVNPTPNDVASVILPQASRQLTRDNMISLPDSMPSVNSIALNSHNAAILLKVDAAPPPAPDTTAPPVPSDLVETEVSSNKMAVADTTRPTVRIASPASGATVTGTVTVTADAADNVGVTGVRFRVDGVNIGAKDSTEPYLISWNTTAAANGSHTLTAVARDAAGNRTVSARVTVTVANETTPPPDTTAPSTPTGLTANAVSTSQINLSWSASTDNVAVTGYRVFRNGTLVASPTSTSVSITGLAASTTYSFTVAALDAAGNASAQSAPLSVTTPAPPDTTAPSVPTGLVATANSPVSLSWTASTDNVGVTGYRVYRDGTLVASPTSTSVSITGLAASTTYSFTVAALDAAGNASAQSAPLSVTTPALPDTTAPSTPTGLTANAVSTSQINLSWSASTDNVAVTGYRVFRNGTLVASPTSTSVSITGLAASTTYSFTVAALDAAGNASAQSAPLSVTTPAPPDTTAPSVPTGLVATANSPVSLSWTASTDNVGVTGYRVYRDGTLVASPTSTSVSITGLAASTTYSFTVAALDAAGNASAQSAPLSVTTPALPDTTAPSTPTGLTANAVSASQINLNWTASTDNVAVTGYRVFRRRYAPDYFGQCHDIPKHRPERFHNIQLRLSELLMRLGTSRASRRRQARRRRRPAAPPVSRRSVE